MPGSNTFSKAFLGFANALIGLLGLAQIIIGAKFLSKGDYDAGGEFDEDMEAATKDIGGASTFVVILGVLLLLFAIFGCVACMFEVGILLLIYWVVIGLYIVSELAFVLYSALNVLSPEQLKVELKKELKEYHPGKLSDDMKIVAPNDSVSRDLYSLQFKAGCCGIDNYTDYKGTIKWNNTIKINDEIIEAVVPPSCCKNETTGTPRKGVLSQKFFNSLPDCLKGDVKSINKDGCVDKIHQQAKDSLLAIIIVNIILFLFQFLSAACAYILWKDVNRRYKEKYADVRKSQAEGRQSKAAGQKAGEEGGQLKAAEETPSA